MRKADDLIEPLTRRELEILALLAEHHTNKEIASSLNLSVNSVKWYARQIYGKLGIANRHQAIDRASALGLLNPVSINGISPSLQTRTLLVTDSADIPKHNLPLQLTTFVGRKAEIEQVKRLSHASRLVTLTGAGGVGKTRLALAVASQMSDEFKDGRWLVELAPLGDPEIIPTAISSIFGVRADQNRSLRTALLDYLREKQLLLILDNCEHLIDACAEIADTILRVCPQVRLLASSREALGIEGEVPFYVPSLLFPDPGKLPGSESLTGYEAVQLFLERARLVLPSFAINETNAPFLAQVCYRLDGIPLALELAAARLQVLSLEQIAARLDNRFRLLTGGSRRALPRHQTLHALIDWSYELLTEAERALFRRLSVFAGSWTLEAAEAVCVDESLTATSSGGLEVPGFSSTEILDLLGELVHKSLITVERDGDVVRCYRMLETIRQYAQEKLVEAGEAEKLRDCHLDYFLRLAEESELLLRDPQVLTRLDFLDGQIGNLRLALSWVLSGDCGERIAKGLRLGSSLCFYWYFRGISDEGIKLLQKGLEILSKNRNNWIQPCAKATFVAGCLSLFTWDFGRFDDARKLLEDSVTLYQEGQDHIGMALAQCALGHSLMIKYITVYRNDVDRVEYPIARSLGEQGLSACRRLGKTDDLAFALLMNLYIYMEGLEFSVAQAYGEEGLALCEKTGDKGVMGIILMGLGDLALIHGDLLPAEKYYQKGLALAQEIKDKVGMMNGFTWLGVVAYYKQDFAGMEYLFLSCLELSLAVGETLYQVASYRCLAVVMLHQAKWRQAREYLLKYLSLALKMRGYEYDQRLFLMGMAGLALGLEQFVQAARLLGTVEAQIECFYKPLDAWDQAEFNRISNEVHIQMDAPTFTAAWSAGRELTLEQAITEARLITP